MRETPTPAEVSEALKMLATMYDWKTALIERQIEMLREVNRLGLENADQELIDLIDATRAKIDEIDANMREIYAAIGFTPPPVPTSPASTTKH